MSIDNGDLRDINAILETGLELDPSADPVRAAEVEAEIDAEELLLTRRQYRCAALTGLLSRNTGEPMEAIAQMACLVGDRMAELER